MMYYFERYGQEKIRSIWRRRNIAVEVPGENTSNEWCEKVTDEEYDKLK